MNLQNISSLWFYALNHHKIFMIIITELYKKVSNEYKQLDTIIAWSCNDNNVKFEHNWKDYKQLRWRNCTKDFFKNNLRHCRWNFGVDSSHRKKWNTFDDNFAMFPWKLVITKCIS